MCVKLNPHAIEWRPSPPLPPPLPPLPHALFTYPPPQYYVTFPSPIYLQNHPISHHHHHTPKKTLKNRLPPRLLKAKAKPPPPPPPPKLNWRPKNAPPLPTLKASPAADASSKTTLMIKNIPNQLRKLGNLGYAFVNFTNAEATVKMKKLLSGFKWREYYTEDGETVCSRKVCEIKWARLQGKEALIRRFEKSTFVCNDEEFLPVVLEPPRDGSERNPAAPVNVGRICRGSY
ncbi:protein MEI2-like 7 [Salvia hispanica]|uniref:protein MEI2-like 7 n=1 Tax=Salvia hispanica TaxID=49212 RepID=UPI002009BAE3|nr:protein MEI2-like 7 [Salvia hispanica]